MRREHRILDFTQRWSIAPRVHQQTVASHSFFVVLYTNIICRSLNFTLEERMACTEYAMVHDLFEAWTSDPPGPAKRSIVDPAKMADYHEKFAEHMGRNYREPFNFGYSTVVREGQAVDAEGKHPIYLVRDIVKIADIIDSIYYLQMEQWLGNHLAVSLFGREVERLQKAMLRLTPADRQVVLELYERGLHDLNRETAFIPSNDSDVEA